MVACLAMSQFRSKTRMNVKKTAIAIEKGVKVSLMVVACCASAGLITGVISMTGLGMRFSDILVAVAGGSMLPASFSDDDRFPDPGASAPAGDVLPHPGGSGCSSAGEGGSQSHGRTSVCFLFRRPRQHQPPGCARLLLPQRVWQKQTRLHEWLDGQARKLRQDVELLEGAANPFELKHYLKGSQTPVFFGSAINNFGVKELLDAFVEMAPAPTSRPTQTRDVSPYEEAFSGFVFKIQANMDPGHRDRIAFLRVCSGKFQRGMRVLHHRIGKEIALANATIFMAQDRTNIEEAYPGDIIGIHNHGTIKIGDTFSEKEPLKFTGIPSFAPEHFRRIRLKNPIKSKQLHKGLLQLAEEGTVQVFRPRGSSDYILGAVGALQFDVTSERLRAEYGADTVYEPAECVIARWVACEDPKRLRDFEESNSRYLAHDAEGHLAFLAPSQYRFERCLEEWPEVKFLKTQEHC